MLDFFSVASDVMPWVIAVSLALVALFFIRIYLQSAVSKKVRSIRDSPSMSMMDVDSMRKQGLVSETEYRAIRHALAEREVEKNHRRAQAERERLILAQAEHDPEAARQLLVPNGHQPPAAPRTSAGRAAAAQQPPLNPATPAKQSPAARGVPHPEAVQGPLRPDPSAPNNGKSRAADLDVLLEKGAITLEEYDRLKAFFE